MLRYAFFVLVIVSSLRALSLSDYIQQCLIHSSESKNLKDTLLTAEYGVNDQLNKYSINIGPNSEVSANDNTNTFALGFAGDQSNQYGGKTYSDIKFKRSAYESNQTEEYTSTLTIGYKQSLFQKIGKDYNTLELYTAQQNLKLQKIKTVDDENQIIIKAISNYYTVVLNKKEIDIYKESLDKAQYSYDEASAKYEAGIVAKIDVHRAKLTLLNAQQNSKISQEKYEDSIEDMFFFANMQISPEAIHSFDLNIKAFNTQDSNVSTESVLNKRYDWIAAKINFEIFKRELFNAKRNFLPDVTLDMNYQLTQSDASFDNTLHDPEEGWNIGLSTNYNFNTDTQKNSYERLIIKQNRLLRDENDLYRSILKNIKSKKNRLNSLEYNIKIAEMKIYESEQSYTFAQEKYNRGLTSNNDLIDAVENLEASKLNYITILKDHNIAYLELINELKILDKNFILRKLHAE